MRLLAPLCALVLGALAAPATARACELEMGTATINSTFSGGGATTVNFAQTFAQVPAVFIIPNQTGGDPCHTRLFNVTTSGFSVACVEPNGNDGQHVAMTVNYVAAMPGTCTLGSTAFETQCLTTSTTIQGPNNTAFDSRTFVSSFASAPAFLAQIQTDNNGALPSVPFSPPCPWLSVAAQNLTATGVQLSLERSEDLTCPVTQAERICYFAGESGAWSFTSSGGAAISCQGTTGGGIQGWDEGCQSVPYSGVGATPLAVGFKTTRAGNNGGWVRACTVGAAGASFVVDEDISNDAERSHTNESVSLFACSAPFHVTATTDADVVDARVYVDSRGRRHFAFDTVSERGSVGFQIARQRAGAWVPIHAGFLEAGFDAPQGARYDVVEGGAASGRATYVVRELSADGSVSQYGPYDIAPSAAQDTAPASAALARVGTSPALAIRTPHAAEAGATQSGALSDAQTRLRQKDLLPSPVVPGPLKLGVRERGIAAVDAAQLQGALGLEPAQLADALARGEGLCVTHQGAPVAWSPLRDGIAFPVRAPSAPFEPEAVYWVDAGPCRAAAIRSAPGAAPEPAASTIQRRVLRDDDSVPLTTIVDPSEPDYWYWQVLFGATGRDVPTNLSVQTPHPRADVAAQLVLRVRKVNAGEHDLEVYVGNQRLGVVHTSAPGALEERFVIPAGLLQDDTPIELRVLAADTPGVFYLRSIEILYSGDAVLGAEALVHRPAADASLTLGAGDEVVAFELQSGERVLLRSEGEHAALQARAGDELVLAEVTRLITPRSLSRGTTGSRPQVEYVVVAPEAFASAAEALVTHRRAQGLSAAFVSTESIYDDFAHGHATPEALERYIASQVGGGSLRYLTLLGDGHNDHRGLRGARPAVPPRMVATASGWFASDNALADVDGDLLPDVAIGRVPVRDAVEARVWLEGLLAAEGVAPLNRVLLLSDDADVAGDFSASQSLLEGRLVDQEVRHVSLDRLALSDARADTFAALGEGTDLVHYIGHGALDRFAAEGLLRSEDVGVEPMVGHPLVVALTCFVNRFDVAGFAPLGVRLARDPAQGARAVWAPLGRSVNADAERLDRAFLDALATQPGARLGDVIVSALQDYAQSSPRDEMLLTYALLGDPASPLPVSHGALLPPVGPPPPLDGGVSPGDAGVGAAIDQGGAPGASEGDTAEVGLRGCAASGPGALDGRSAGAVVFVICCALAWGRRRRRRAG